MNEIIRKAKDHFEAIIREQLARVESMKKDTEWTDFKALQSITIGICPGDGIGPEISGHAVHVLENVLKDEISLVKVKLKNITGLTIENRARHKKAIPDDVLEEIKSCDVILKGPTTTPQAGDKWPNIESANVAMRRALDLFANVRPIKIPEKEIDWCFFRENTEGSYILGSKGINVTGDLSVDFNVTTEQGSDRIIRMAFEYARSNGLKKVTVVTKSNVVKTTDGRFSEVAKRIAKEYEKDGIKREEWYIDIMTAKLIDPARNKDFKVIVLPNLYGDILTDEAAQIQGGVGTAGSANIGKKWAMFEAIHGSAPRMVEEGRAAYANPSSIIKAAGMLVRHIGFPERASRLDMALDICAEFEKKKVITGNQKGATGSEFTEYLLDTLKSSNLENKWREYTPNPGRGQPSRHPGRGQRPRAGI